MFQRAFSIAREYTRPVVIAQRTISGKCTSGIASYIVLNSDGWILTAHHVLGACIAMAQASAAMQQRLAALAAVKSDKTLNSKARRDKIASLGGEPNPKDLQIYASMWGGGDVGVDNVTSLPTVDLAVGRLTKFDPASVKCYPVIKDPSKNFEPGVSLCKLGYPFYELPIAWDDQKGFVPKDGNANINLPLFPIDGMLTRFVQAPEWVAEEKAAKLAYPLMHLETSTPGLKGQSGGPTFDVEGRLWAIQVRTAHLSLGFDPEIRDKVGGTRREHQFLNVGHGVHAATIVGLLNQLGIRFELSKD